MHLLTTAVQAGAFIAAFAAIAAGILMARVTGKLGSGILSSGFKTVSFGLILIAIGIISDAGQVYFDPVSNSLISNILRGAREIVFVCGTFLIVIGSKNVKDKLESLTN